MPSVQRLLRSVWIRSAVGSHSVGTVFVHACMDAARLHAAHRCCWLWCMHACSTRDCRRCPAWSLAAARIRTALSVNESSVTRKRCDQAHISPRAALGSQHHDTPSRFLVGGLSLTCLLTACAAASGATQHYSNSHCSYCHMASTTHGLHHLMWRPCPSCNDVQCGCPSCPARSCYLVRGDILSVPLHARTLARPAHAWPPRFPLCCTLTPLLHCVASSR